MRMMTVLTLRCCLLAGALLLAAPAFSQTRDRVTAEYGTCGAANGGGQNSTNFYGGRGDSCAFTYSVPAERINQLLNDANYCTMYSRTQVNCSRELRGAYGQIRLDRRDGAGAGGGRNPGSAADMSYPTAPASSITPAQRAEADRMWQRSVQLINGNNYREAIPLLLQAGRLGDARAQATLGIAYQVGNGVRKDDVAAAHWFSLAAAQGHRASQYALAGMYEEGDGGLSKDRSKARQLYMLSSNQGFDKAQMEMGMAYEVGDGVPRSRERAIQLLHASGLGNATANVLSSPQTPARFADQAALGAYLRKLADIENARVARRAADSTPNPYGSGNPIDRINAARENYEFAHKWDPK